VGRTEDAEEARRALDRLSWDDDPWLVLEAAWRELPAPRTDELISAEAPTTAPSAASCTRAEATRR
jgi:hypothetical protein